MSGGICSQHRSVQGGGRGVRIGNGWNMEGAMMGGKGRDGGGRGKEINIRQSTWGPLQLFSRGCTYANFRVKYSTRCALAAQKSYRLSHVCYELLLTDVSPDKDLRSEVGSDWLSKVSFSCVKVIKQYGLIRWPVVRPLTSNLGVNSACQASAAAAAATDLQFTLPPSTWILLPHINQLSRL